MRIVLGSMSPNCLKRVFQSGFNPKLLAITWVSGVSSTCKVKEQVLAGLYVRTGLALEESGLFERSSSRQRAIHKPRL